MINKGSVLIVWIFLMGVSVYASEITTLGQKFLDPQGRQVLLHGVNLSNSAKVPPFKIIDDVQKLKWIKKWGLNNIRLIFNWEAFEPQKGQKNQNYLDDFVQIAQYAADLGLYIVVDFHSDGFSRYLSGGCGSGFPVWTLPPDVVPSLPKNDSSCRLWAGPVMFEYYTGGAQKKMSDAFFENKFGAKEAFMAMLGDVTRALKSNSKVIGYDVLNEPLGDEVLQVGPFYQEAAERIHSIDPTALIFVEPFIMAVSSLAPSMLPRPSFEGVVYASHNYDLGVLGPHLWFAGNFFIGQGIQRIAKVQKEWDVPVYIGEFGAPAESQNLRDYVKQNYMLHEQNLFSWAQWNFNTEYTEQNFDGWNQENMSITTPEGQMRINFELRAYPQKISGDLLAYKYLSPQDQDPSNLLFEAVWQHNPNLGKTEIFIPQGQFGIRSIIGIKGLDGASDLSCAWSLTEPNILECQSLVAGQKHLQIYLQ